MINSTQNEPLIVGDEDYKDMCKQMDGVWQVQEQERVLNEEKQEKTLFSK